MELRERFIEVKGVERFNLFAPGDLQKGARGFREDLWERFKSDAKSSKTPPIFIGMGDYHDEFRPTIMDRLRRDLDGDDAYGQLDQIMDKHVDQIIEMLKPLLKRGICLGLLEGHHKYLYSTGITSTQKICEYFRVPYLDEMAMVRLVFGNKQSDWSMVIHAQHGSGGSSKIGTDVGSLENKTVPHWDADLFLRGHSTKQWTGPFAKKYLSDRQPLKLITKKCWMVNTGGFMEGYLPGEKTYVSRTNLPPAALGYPIVHIDLARHHTGNKMDLPSREVILSVTQR
jgi:hypothetical protein